MTFTSHLFLRFCIISTVSLSVAPAVTVVVPLRSIAEEQFRNSEFDLKIGTDNKSSRDPEILFNRVQRSIEAHGQFTEDFTTERRRYTLHLNIKIYDSL